MKFSAPIRHHEPLELPLAFGHFLPWFTLKGSDYPLPEAERAPLIHLPAIEDYRHWNDSRAGYWRTHHHVPLMGLYDSRNPDVIEWQIHTALAYGLQGFILNWYGKYSVENVITLHWLRGLDRWNREHPDRLFYYFFSIDSQCLWPTEGKTPVSLEEDLTYIRDHLMRPSYLHRDGRPVLSVFPYANNCAEWQQTLKRVFPNGVDFIWRGLPADGQPQGCYAWVQPDEATIDLSKPCCWQQPDNAGDGFLRKFMRECNQRSPSMDYIMAGIWPGFNNQFVSWAWSPNPDAPHIRPCVICRETTRGNTLDLTWQAYLDYLQAWANHQPEARLPAPLIQLVTWNDYAETTTLEPTRDYGEAPLDLCRRRLTEARTIWNR
jgi:hypothetical protein